MSARGVGHYLLFIADIYKSQALIMLILLRKNIAGIFERPYYSLVERSQHSHIMKPDNMLCGGRLP